MNMLIHQVMIVFTFSTTNQKKFPDGSTGLGIGEVIISFKQASGLAQVLEGFARISGDFN